MSEHVRESRWQ